ncbi:MAG: SEL1-like repeat protein, partial [Lachnospiraceae bacterium]|nr:SEL1-like repeat protein [Lachnospiraceae bacterium]
MEKVKSRAVGLDIVRSFAALFVVCVHFYLNCGYYYTPMQGAKMYVMTAARWFFLICVPLYMLLTGYLKCHKTISKEHYLSLVPILTAYVVISVIKIFVSNHFYGKIYFFKESVQSIANYTFAWYAGMYVCLTLLIPFLNILWQGLPTKREKLILLGSLVFICSLFPVVVYIAPSYWQILYPILYYYLGVYIREYRPKVSKLLLVALIVLTTLINATVSFIGAKGEFFNWNLLGPVDSGYPTVTVVICATAFFLLFYDIESAPEWLCKLTRLISEVSFEIYMFTGCFDAAIYSIMFRYTGGADAHKFFWLFFILVPLNFILSFLASRMYRFCYQRISRLVPVLMSIVLAVSLTGCIVVPKDQGVSETQEQLLKEGRRCYYAEGVSRDLEQAREYFSKVLEISENAEASYFLGRISEAEEDYESAKTQYEKAVEQGSDLGRLALGMLYQKGRGTDMDLDKAVLLYKEAEKNGCIEANCGLGDLYQKGLGGYEQDAKKAIACFETAANAPEREWSAYACSSIAYMYYSEDSGVDQDYEKAMEWFLKAAEAGRTSAMNYIARMYALGQGVKEDNEEALSWYQKAAEAGDTTAMINA